eukprot:GEMP01005937.1.p1 GENE.GEMP01005937.1~~GEMP01005937.1.p1  ORF type:complete len:461 (+),score=109.78 GEMP01005937.1:226-1608(+)
MIEARRGETASFADFTDSKTPPLPKTAPHPHPPTTNTPPLPKRPPVPKLLVPSIPKLHRISAPPPLSSNASTFAVNFPTRKNTFPQPKRSVTPKPTRTGGSTMVPTRSITPQPKRGSLSQSLQIPRPKRDAGLLKPAVPRVPLLRSGSVSSLGADSTAPDARAAVSRSFARPTRSSSLASRTNSPLRQSTSIKRSSAGPSSTFGYSSRNTSPLNRDDTISTVVKRVSKTAPRSAPKALSLGTAPGRVIAGPKVPLKRRSLTITTIPAPKARANQEVKEDNQSTTQLQGLEEFLSTINHCEDYLQQSKGDVEESRFPLVMRLLQENADLRERAKEFENELAEARRIQFSLEEDNRNLVVALKKRDQEWQSLQQQLDDLKEEFKQATEEEREGVLTPSKIEDEAEESPDATSADTPEEVPTHKEAVEEVHAKQLSRLMESVVEFANKQTSLLSVAVDAVNVL